jgi:hypothetical protein
MKKIYCFWFGGEMSHDRFNCLNSIINNSGCEVVLITEDNLKSFEVSEYPIHDGFKYLSLTHKSDYLRSYFMYLYGGGYTDIKYCDYNWNPYFDLLDNSDKDFISYRELGEDSIAHKEWNNHIRFKFNELGGMCHYIFKPKSDFGLKWFELTNKKMDEIYETLKDNPGTYHPRAVTGGAHQGPQDDSKYPLGWNDLLGQLLHNLMYENIGRFLLDMPFPNTWGYR